MERNLGLGSNLINETQLGHQVSDDAAVKALAALAQTHRLKVFRLLVGKGDAGCPAGEIAKSVGLAPSNLSFHISQLESAGLVRATRKGRIINYAINDNAAKSLLGFLSDMYFDNDASDEIGLEVVNG